MTYSNSLFFELKRNWTGLLIEMDPARYQNIVSRKRNAYSINCCLSLQKGSQMLMIRRPRNVVQCFSLYSLLVALGQKDINYFSLDVDGPELDILQTIPFDKVKIDIITVEYHASPETEEASLQKLQKLRDFFNNLGNYKEVGFVGDLDVVFQRQN